MSARDEVAQTIADAADKYRALPGGRTPTTQDFAAADALLAEGYTKHRTITSVEELDALSVSTVIRAVNGEVFEKQADGPYCDGPHDWQNFEGTFWNGETFVFPATVLHEPEAGDGA